MGMDGAEVLSTRFNSKPVYEQELAGVAAVTGKLCVFQITEHQFTSWLTGTRVAVFLGFTPSLAEAIEVVTRAAEQARRELPAYLAEVFREGLKEEGGGDAKN